MMPNSTVMSRTNYATGTQKEMVRVEDLIFFPDFKIYIYLDSQNTIRQILL